MDEFLCSRTREMPSERAGDERKQEARADRQSRTGECAVKGCAQRRLTDTAPHLAAAAAEDGQVVRTRAVTFGLGQGPDGLAHSFVCDLEEAERDLLRRLGDSGLAHDLFGQGGEEPGDDLEVERLV